MEETERNIAKEKGIAMSNYALQMFLGTPGYTQEGMKELGRKLGVDVDFPPKKNKHNENDN